MATKNLKSVSADTESLLLSALEQGGDASLTGRFLLTFKDGATQAGVNLLKSNASLKIADTRDFNNQMTLFEQAGGADGLLFSEIGVLLLGGEAAAVSEMTPAAAIAEESPIHSINPEYFMFPQGIDTGSYLKGVVNTAGMIARDLAGSQPTESDSLTPEVLGEAWGVTACKASASSRSGNGIKVAILDTGFDLGHPEFAGRTFVTKSFVPGQTIQDLNGHGTHMAGSACGPKAPAGAVPRYGIAFQSQIFVAKVLSNSGSGAQSGVLAGINWAIANRCTVILVALGAAIPVQPAYTAAGSAALANGCLIIAPAGHGSNRPTTIAPAAAPANSSTIVSVGALTKTLKVAPFSAGGKIDLAAPGIDIYSSFRRPELHKIWSGTSSAAAYAAGCAALWAQTSPSLRGASLRAKLFQTAKRLPFPASDVGAGLVQAP